MELGIQIFNDRNNDTNSIALYSLPGGKTIRTYYDGTVDKRLNYELTGKVFTQDRNVLINALNRIVEELENEPKITSNNSSFETADITITSEPYYSDVTSDGFIYFRLTIQVGITVLK